MAVLHGRIRAVRSHANELLVVSLIAKSLKLRSKTRLNKLIALSRGKDVPAQCSDRRGRYVRLHFRQLDEPNDRKALAEVARQGEPDEPLQPRDLTHVSEHSGRNHLLELLGRDRLGHCRVQMLLDHRKFEWVVVEFRRALIGKGRSRL